MSFLVINQESNDENELLVCRGCLATDVPLQKLNGNLCVALSQITGNLVSMGDKLPHYICVSCHYKTTAFSKFHTRCVKSDIILKRYQLWNKLNMKNIINIDRSELNSELGLSKTAIQVLSLMPRPFDPNSSHLGAPALELRPVPNEAIEGEEAMREACVNTKSQLTTCTFITNQQLIDTLVTEKSLLNDVTLTRLINKELESETAEDCQLNYKALVEGRYTPPNITVSNHVLQKDVIGHNLKFHKELAHGTGLEGNQQPDEYFADNQSTLQVDVGTFHSDLVEEDIKEESLEEVDSNEQVEEDQDEITDTKDDIIIKEENLIHTVDDDGNETEETTDQKDEPSKQFAEDTVSNSQEGNKIEDVQSISLTSSSSSSSSSSDSDSSSSTSSDSDSDLEIRVIKPAQIDLTAEDDDINVPLEGPNDPVNEPTNISTVTNATLAPEKVVNDTESTKAVCNDVTKETDIMTDNKEKSVSLEKGVIHQEESSSQLLTVEDSSSINNHNSATCNNKEIRHSSNKGSDKRILVNINCSSETSDSDDMPDCFFGLNKDIYKKDVKRNFPKAETDLHRKWEKVRYVDEIYVREQNGGTKRTHGDGDILSHKVIKISDIDEDRQEFESKKKVRKKKVISAPKGAERRPK